MIVFYVVMKCFVDDVCDEVVFSLSIVGTRSSIYQFPFTTEDFHLCDLKCRRRVYRQINQPRSFAKLIPLLCIVSYLSHLSGSFQIAVFIQVTLAFS